MAVSSTKILWNVRELFLLLTVVSVHQTLQCGILNYEGVSGVIKQLPISIQTLRDAFLALTAIHIIKILTNAIIVVVVQARLTMKSLKNARVLKVNLQLLVILFVL